MEGLDVDRMTDSFSYRTYMFLSLSLCLSSLSGDSWEKLEDSETVQI